MASSDSGGHRNSLSGIETAAKVVKRKLSRERDRDGPMLLGRLYSSNSHTNINHDSLQQQQQAPSPPPPPPLYSSSTDLMSYMPGNFPLAPVNPAGSSPQPPSLSIQPPSSVPSPFPTSATTPGHDPSPISPSVQLNELRSKIGIENKIKEGAESLLQALDSKKQKNNDKIETRKQAKFELDAANSKIIQLAFQANNLAPLPLPPLKRSISRSKRIQLPAIQIPQNEFISVLDTRQQQYQQQQQSGMDSPTGSPTWSFGELLQSLEKPPDQDPNILVDKANRLVDLLTKHPLLKFDLVMPVYLQIVVQHLLLSKVKEVVACGYRLIRYVLSDEDSLKVTKSFKLDYFLIQSLAKDAKASIERIQAVKLIREFSNVPNGTKYVSRGVVRALVAVVEHTEDGLRSICLETLAELLILGPQLVYSAGGIHTLLQCIVDGPFESSTALCLPIIYILNTPESRKYLKSSSGMDYLMSGFADLHLQTSVNDEKLRNSAHVIVLLFNSWAGLIALSAYNFRAIRMLIDSLMSPNASLRNIIMDLILELLRIRLPEWSESSLLRSRTSDNWLFSNNDDPSHPSSLPVYAITMDGSSYDLTRHHTALLLAILLRCDLVERLIHVVKSTSSDQNRRKALLLFGQMINLSGKLLPQDQVIRLQHLASTFDLEEDPLTANLDRFVPSSTVFQIDRVTRSLSKFEIEHTSHVYDFSNPRVSRSKKAGLVKMTLGLQIEDSHFRSLILDTRVLVTKNYSKWNWDALESVIQGPLLNPRRLDEAIRATKFMKRLLSFYRPFKYRFSYIKRTQQNSKVVKVGCALFSTLLSSSEGIRYLIENKLLRQIAECLAQLDPVSGIISSDPLFSKDRLINTLSYGYFAMLGTLSADRNGIKMMQRWRMFNMFYHLSELEDRDDVMYAFISNMNFEVHDHPRIILIKALTTGTKNVRMFATEHLGTLLGPGMKTREWVVPLLVDQLYDPDFEVCKLAASVLGEACAVSNENLKMVIDCRPCVDHLGEAASPLLLKFLSSSVGFRYLEGLDYINQEMDYWLEVGNYKYVEQVESALNATYQASRTVRRTGHGSAYHMRHISEIDGPSTLGGTDFQIVAAAPPPPLSAGLRSATGSDTTPPASGIGIPLSATVSNPSPNLVPGASTNNAATFGTDRLSVVDSFVTLPPHFFRELARTNEGCSLLTAKGHFLEFARIIHNHKHEDRDPKIIMKLKACIWAVGNIGSLPLGAKTFLDEAVTINGNDGKEDDQEADIVSDIVDIAQNSKVWDLRGSAFFVLGMISQTPLGMEMLDQIGWESAVDMNGASVGCTLPRDLCKFLYSDDWEAKVEVDDDDDEELMADDESQQELSIMLAKEDQWNENISYKKRGDGTSQVDKQIIRCLCNLGNHILANEASRKLVKLEMQYPDKFQSNCKLFTCAMGLLERYRYRQPVRRFILDLFSVNKILGMMVITPAQHGSDNQSSSSPDRPSTPSSALSSENSTTALSPQTNVQELG